MPAAARVHPTTLLVCAAHALGLVAGPVALASVLGPDGAWLFSDGQRLAAACLSVLAAGTAGLALAIEWRRRPTPLVSLRHLFLAASAWVVVQWVLSNRFHPSLAWTTAAILLGAFGALRLLWPWLHAPLSRTWPRRLDRWLFQAALGLVLLEVSLRAAGSITASPYFGLLDEDERSMMRRFGMAPGQVHMGFPCNAHGHYDEEFVPGTGARNVVVSIGDSFAVGVVPHRHHFTTVCERELPGVAVHNLGISGIGPAGYHHLLTELGLALRPDAVVVQLFLGNDVGNASRWQDRRSLWASVLDRRNARAIQVPLRLWRARLQPAGLAAAAGGHPFPGVDALVPGCNDADLNRALPWLEDPLLEPPMFTPEAFLAMEVDRLRMLAEAEERGLYASMFGALEAMHRACGATPLAVVLIPDEFQVEDELWDAVETQARTGMPRDEPQRIVAQWLRAAGIPHVDLLPELRALAPLGDGKRHAYHLRDAHFNRRGNAVAGQALAELLRRLL